MLSGINAAQPGYAEGAGKLADAWAAERITQTTYDERVKSGSLYTWIIGAWSNHGANDEAFVQDFGSKDPIAVQKFAELSSEQYYEDDIAAARSQFYRSVAQEIGTAPKPRDRVFPILSAKRIPFLFKGKKIDPAILPQFINRTHSAATLKDSLSTAGKLQVQNYVVRQVAAKRGISEDRVRAKADVMASFDEGKALLAGLRDGSLQPLQVVDRGRGLTAPGRSTWFSPDQATVVPAGDTGFAELMKIGALQPEWYPEGTVSLNIQPDKASSVTEARKPTAFDGLLSALWVSRNQQDQTYGVTGGGAREFLMKGVTWGEVTSATAQIPSDAFMGELQRLADQFKSVDGQSTTPGEEILRGNLDPTGRTRSTYQNVFGATAQEANSPSKVAGQAAPEGGQVVAAGGSLDQGRLGQTAALPGSHLPPRR